MFTPLLHQNQRRKALLPAGILAGLAIFGFIYDRFTNWCLRHIKGEQKSSLFVAGGVTITVLALSPLIGRRAATWVLAGFIASGSPMILGQFRRHARNYRRALARLGI